MTSINENHANICAEQDCPWPPNRPGQPLCLEHYRAFQAGGLDECPNCPAVYKPSEYPVCRECNQRNRRRPTGVQIRERRDEHVDDSRGWDQQPMSQDKPTRSEAARVIGQARLNLTFHQDACENHEASTIQYLIMPVLAGLGWDIHDPSQVATEYRPPANRNVRPDIALKYSGTPVAFIEAKRLDREYSSDYGAQLAKYAEYLADGNKAVLTNGRFWQICVVSDGTPNLRETIDITRGEVEEAAAKLSNALGKSALQVDAQNLPPTVATTHRAAPDSDTIVRNLERYLGQEASRRGVPLFVVLTNDVISLVAEQRPVNLIQLRAIHGVGPATVEQHGKTIIAIVLGQWVQ